MTMGKEEITGSRLWDAMAKGETDEAKLVRIEFFMCFIFAIFLILFAGALRRVVRHRLFRIVFWAAHAGSYSTFFYTVGLINSTSFQLDLLAIWAMLVLYALDSTDFLTAYSIEETEQFLKSLFDTFVAVVYVGMVVAAHTKESKLQLAIWCLYASCMARMGVKITALYLASKSSMANSNKVLSDYMRDEHEQLASAGVGIVDHGKRDDQDANHLEVMEGCNYIVWGDDENMALLEEPQCHYRLYVDHHEVVTVKKVWTCKGSLLSSVTSLDKKKAVEEDHRGTTMAGRLKDVCLSFVLFKLLRRRLAGYTSSEMETEQGRARSRRLINDGLLTDSVDRAFRVVEMELVFLYDFFYTKYAAMIERGFPSAKIATECTTIIFTVIIAVRLHEYEPPLAAEGSFQHGRLVIDLLVTKIMLYIWLVTQVIQLYAFWTSNWLRVWLVSQYVRPCLHPVRRSLIEILLWLSTRRLDLTPSWSRTIGQHEVVTSTFLNNKDWWRWESVTDQILLPCSVKQTLLHRIKDYISDFDQPCSSQHELAKSKVEELQSKYQLNTPAHTILVWHIATWLLYSQLDHNSRSTNNAEVAKYMSNYCCYLVESIPELIPGTAYNTMIVYRSLVVDIEELILELKQREKAATLIELVGALNKIDDDNVSLLQKGVQLSKQISGEAGVDELWAFLADFWCETMLYIAPWGDSSTHMQQLRRGGELITHLWALLSHAGIHQPQPSNLRCRLF